MSAKLEGIRNAWLAASKRQRLLITTLLCALGMVAIWGVLSIIDAELSRLEKAVPLASARLQHMQDNVAEVARLRAQPNVGTLQPGLGDALAASIRSHHLNLAVATQGVDRHQVHGTADFDPTIAWLASVQRDYKLRVARFSASRNNDGTRIDILLVPGAGAP